MKTKTTANLLLFLVTAIVLSACNNVSVDGYPIVKSVKKIESGQKNSSMYLYDAYCYDGEIDQGNGFHIFTNFQYEVGDTLFSRKQMLGVKTHTDSCKIKLMLKARIIDSLQDEIKQKNMLLKFLLNNEINTGKGQ